MFISNHFKRVTRMVVLLVTVLTVQTVHAAFSADLDNNNRVDIFDYNILVINFNKTGAAGFIPADIDKNGIIDIFDFNLLVSEFGKTITSTPVPTQLGTYTYKRLMSPIRTEVYDATGQWLATFTQGSYTVSLRGAERSWNESATPYTVRHAIWIRLLPAPFNGTVNTQWLTTAISDIRPDIIAIAFQYVAGAVPVIDGSGRQSAGDASYGPLVGGARQEGSDFNDYLGLQWSYSDGTVDVPEQSQFRSLDCSGYIRMIWGYRSQLSMSIFPSAGTIPRRSFEIFASAPGGILIQNTGIRITDYSLLQVGDLVFFDASADDGIQIDHVGMYLGKDNGGHDRFISSRKSSDGPTMGDYNGASILDGNGLYARSLRGVRRL